MNLPAEYGFKTVFLSGANNSAADNLSRVQLPKIYPFPVSLGNSPVCIKAEGQPGLEKRLQDAVAHWKVRLWRWPIQMRGVIFVVGLRMLCIGMIISSAVWKAIYELCQWFLQDKRFHMLTTTKTDTRTKRLPPTVSPLGSGGLRCIVR